MAESADRFAQLLTEAIYQIRLHEHKNISIVQDEVGYAIGRDGGSPIEYWRKGHVPKEREEVEGLVGVLLGRGKMDESWLADFLDAAGYIMPQPLIDQHFPDLVETKVVDGGSKPRPVDRISTLPLAPTPFVGRQAEIDEVYELMSGEECRLITLLGPGGIGKTRLAVEIGRKFEEKNQFENGIVYVPLASVGRAAEIASAIAQALNLQLSGSQDAMNQIIGYLQTQRLLLILDNFERLIDKGAEQIAEVLSQAPNIKIIVTSRERLNLRWEQLFPLEGLSSGDQKTGGFQKGSAYSEAADLFIGCVERAQPNYALTADDHHAIGDICHMVAGFPLALELAASWTTMLSIPEIAAEINSGMDLLETSRTDMPERHRSLRAVCDYSIGALDEADQAVFKQLSIFRGGFSRQAALKIAGADLMALSRLLDKSLVRLTGRNRYDLHLILRQYGYELLVEDDAQYQRVSQAHMSYYNAALVEIAPDLGNFQHMELLQDVGEDLENVRKMWQNAIGYGRLDLIDRAADGMMLYFHMSGRFQMGVTEFSAALESGKIPADSILQIRLLNRQGLMHLRLNQAAEAMALLNDAVSISRKIDNDLEIPMSHNFLSTIYYSMGRNEQALALLEENLTMESNKADPVFESSTLNNLGTVSGRMGRYDQALKYLEEAEAVYRDKVGQAWGLALFYQIHGDVAYHAGDYEGAERYFQVAIETYRDLGYDMGKCTSTIQLAESLKMAKRPIEAANEFHDALDLADQLHAIPLMLRATLGLAQVPPLRHNEDLVYEIASLVEAHPASEDEVRKTASSLLAGRPRFPYGHSNGEWLVDIVKRIQ